MATRVPKVPPAFVPAGYLPAPKQAQFISEAEQAATKLPPTIKPPSLKNALLKAGAKPIELEYAGVDKFVSGYQGKPVPREDVLDFLKREGPLGQLKRVEQRTLDPGEKRNHIDWAGQPVEQFEAEMEGMEKPRYAANFRAPFDTQDASSLTNYHEYTVPGARGDISGYREALIQDPRNSGSRPLVEGNNTTEAVDAHNSDYWVRYNEYPDRIALQNIQSDIGQSISKNSNQPAMTLAEAESIIFRHEGGADFPRHLLDQAGRVTGNPDYDPDFDPNSDFSSEPQSYSPIAADGNWKNLMARHIALQSINGGGKPITIPTGKQMVDVEGFGLQTHGDPRKAAEAATEYNADLVRRLQKIFRGLHPDGASASNLGNAAEEIITSQDKKYWDDKAQDIAVSGAGEMSRIFKSRGARYAKETGLSKQIDQKLAEYDQLGRSLPPKDDPSYAEKLQNVYRVYDEYRNLQGRTEDLRRLGMLEASNEDEGNLWGELTSWHPGGVGEMSSKIEQIANSGNISPELLEKVMPYIQYNRLMSEMGDAGISKPDPKVNRIRELNKRSQENGLTSEELQEMESLERAVALSGQPQPGWTVTPSPAAVRAALERGLPIMSLLGGLLAPQGEQKK